MATASQIRPDRVSEEDHILRAWTPVILRSVVLVAVVLLIVGLGEATIASFGSYISRFHELQRGVDLRRPENPALLLLNAASGDGHATMTIGLFVLTLVPIGRVAFTSFIFLREKDYAFVAMTAYVLAALIIGAALGRIG